VGFTKNVTHKVQLRVNSQKFTRVTLKLTSKKFTLNFTRVNFGGGQPSTSTSPDKKVQRVTSPAFNPGDDVWEQHCVFRNSGGEIVEQSSAVKDRNLVYVHVGDGCGEPLEVFQMLEKYKGPLKRVMTKDELIQIRLANVTL
jgi:hypothetical protein